MKPKHNRIIANRFRAQRLAQVAIAFGPQHPQWQPRISKLFAFMELRKLTLADLGMTERAIDSA
jgi:hypothetical protein